MRTGIVVAVEGANGAGKTTLVHKLAHELASRGLLVETFKSPNPRTRVGQLVQELVATRETTPDEVLLPLFSVDRLEWKPHLQEALAAGSIALCDRYTPSEYAYGVAAGLPIDWLVALESRAIPPHLVILLDIEPRVALARINQHRQDRFEADADVLTRVREAYLQLVHRDIDVPWLVLDATDSLDSIFERARVEIERIYSATGVSSNDPR